MSLPRLLLVAALLFASTAHATEVALSAPRFVPATGAEFRPVSSIASGNGTDLVAWTEQIHSFDFVPITGRVFIRTYGADGAPLQPAQIAIGFGSHPVAVWNGSDYFVAFGRFYSRYGTFVPSPDVEAVRVTSDGRVIDGSRVSLIETRATGGNITALAWDGTHYLASVTTDADAKLLLLDRDGHVVRSHDGFALSIAALPGGGFVIVRSGPDKLELVRVTRDGDLGAPVTLGSSDRPEAKIGVHGDRIAVAWRTASGVVAEELDNDAHVVVSVALPDDATIESIVWREASWVVAYDRTSAGCIVRFGSGVASSTTCSDTARQPFAGVDRTVWIEPGVEVRTSRDLSLAGGDLASASATTQSDAAVATSTGSIVAWFEAGAMHVGGLTRDGSRRPDRIIDAEAEAHHPAMATAGAQTLLVYVDGNAFGSGTIRALRLDADGQALAPAFTLGQGAAPAVATDGREWLVVWQSSDGTKVRPQVLAARVTANGDATAEALVFANDAGQYHPLVAWSGAAYLVAWVEGETAASGTHSRVMTQLVDRNGTRIANELTLADDAIATFNTAAIACGPKSCLVAWNGNGLGIFAAVVAPDGTRRSENRQLLPFLSQSAVSIAAEADGTFRVVQENRYLFLDSLGARLADVTWLSSRADVAGIVGGRIIYVRATAPEELFGGAMRLFAREEPSLPRMRSAVR
jgi:YD repeat-containing protein